MKHQDAIPWPKQTEISVSAFLIVRNYFQLTKPRITLLVVISTLVGYYFGEGPRANILTLFNVLLGTAFMASASATLNQWYERDIDAKMTRTQMRPIPSGAIQPNHALYFGIGLSILSVIELSLFTNTLTVGICLITSVGYLFVYTPLKRKGPICTTIGAIPGAMPPLIGCAAARGHLTFEAWILFGILFFWQFPHFHAIARMYREDYARGGVKMLAVVQPDGRQLRLQIIGALIFLIPLTLAPTLVHMTGLLYFVAALFLGFLFLYFGFRICREYTYARARDLLLASVIYIPLLFGFLVVDKLFS